MFPEKFYFTTEPEKMREIFSFLITKCTPNFFVSHFDLRYVCCQSLMKESKFNQFGTFGTFNSSNVGVMPRLNHELLEKLFSISPN